MSINLVEYWQEETPNESLVLSLDWDELLCILTIVYDYAAESVSRHFQGLPSLGYRDFRKLRLSEVNNLKVTSFRSADPIDSLLILKERIKSSHVCVISYEIMLVRDRYLLELELSSCFALSFQFGEANVERRCATPTKVGDKDWQYHDTETGEGIDFYHPFGNG